MKLGPIGFNIKYKDKYINLLSFCFIIKEEDSCPPWERDAHGNYGMAITYWRRKLASKWHVGIRISLLTKYNHPYLRLTTYSFPHTGRSCEFISLRKVLKP